MNTFSRLAAFLLLLFAPVVQAQYSTGVPTGGSLSDVEAAKYIKLPGTYTAATLPGVYTVGLGTTAYTTDSGVVVATSVGWSPISSSGPLAPIPDGTLLGNSSGSTAAPSALTSPTISGTLTSGGLITSGSLKFSASSLSMSGTLGPTNSLLYMPGVSLSGAPPTPASGQISPMGLYLSGDAVDTTTTGNGNLIGLSVLDAPSAGFTGGRSAIQGYVAVVGTPTTLSSAGIVGVTSLTRVSANMTGATGAYTNYKGDTFGGNSNVFTTSGATFLKTVNGHEFDTAIVTGASAADHFGISIVKTANDALRGAYDDSAISVNDQDGVTVGWLYGISFGSYAHHWPFANDSTLIGAQLRQSGGAETDNALNGVDFRNVSFQAGGFAFASTGFTVNPSGAVTGTTLALNSTSCPSGNGLNTPLAPVLAFVSRETVSSTPPQVSTSPSFRSSRRARNLLLQAAQSPLQQVGRMQASSLWERIAARWLSR